MQLKYISYCIPLIFWQELADPLVEDDDKGFFGMYGSPAIS